MAYAITALLETPLGNTGEKGDAENMNPNAMSAGGAKEAAAKQLDQIQGRLHDNFWVAYDALDCG